jgi:hypothetical protein
MRTITLIICSLLALGACSDDGGSSPADSALAPDSTVSDGSGPTPDQNVSQPDGSAPADSTAADSAVTPDSAPAPDSGGPAADASPYAGNVECSGASCTLPAQICCVQSPLLGGTATLTCKDPASCPAGIFGTKMQAPQFCDGPEDCDTATPVCCAIMDVLQVNKSGVYCKAAADCPGTKAKAIICHTDQDCSGGRTCKPCTPPGATSTLMCVQNNKCPY